MRLRHAGRRATTPAPNPLAHLTAPRLCPAPFPPASWVFFSDLPILKLPEVELPIGSCRDWDCRSVLAEWQWGRADRDLPIFKPRRGLLPRSNPLRGRMRVFKSLRKSSRPSSPYSVASSCRSTCGIRLLRHDFIKRRCTGTPRTSSHRSKTGEGALQESGIRPTETFFPDTGDELYQN